MKMLNNMACNLNLKFNWRRVGCKLVHKVLKSTCDFGVEKKFWKYTNLKKHLSILLYLGIG
jgi:hypothetical protein